MTSRNSTCVLMILAAVVLAVSADKVSSKRAGSHKHARTQQQHQPADPPEQWLVDNPRQVQNRNNPSNGRERRTVKLPGRNHRSASDSGSNSQPGQPGIDQSPVPPEYQATLDQHNTYRALHQAPPLQWNAALAAQVAAYAANCVFEHGAFGENLYVTTRINNVPAALQSAVKAWYDEVALYNFTQPGFSRETGHFTQVVWKSSELLGCAAQVCTGPIRNTTFQQGTLVICRYLPYGNVLGRFAENVLPPKPTVAATYIQEGQVLASPGCYASPNDKFLLCMRRDSRLVLMHRGNAGNYTLWSNTDTRRAAGVHPTKAQLQPDGSITVSDGIENLWASSLFYQGTPPRRLALQDDGNLVLYDSRHVLLWQTATAGAIDQWLGKLIA